MYLAFAQLTEKISKKFLPARVALFPLLKKFSSILSVSLCKIYIQRIACFLQICNIFFIFSNSFLLILVYLYTKIILFYFTSFILYLLFFSTIHFNIYQKYYSYYSKLKIQTSNICIKFMKCIIINTKKGQHLLSL